MKRRVVAVAIVASFACNDSALPEQKAVVLRVSAADGLSPFVPSADDSGATAYALELAYAPSTDHVSVASRDRNVVILRPHFPAKYSTDRLAATFRFQGLSKTTVVSGQLRAEFVDEKSARSLVEAGPGGFALGPYVLDSQNANVIRLRARSSRPIHTIEIVAVKRGEEWRRLLAHDIDVIPSAAQIHRAQFNGMASIRTIDLPSPTTMTMVFNTQSPKLSDVQVRRHIARAVDRESLATLVCGSPNCAAVAWGAARPIRKAKIPKELSIMVLETDSTAVAAARILRHQLRSIGILIAVQVVSLSQLRSRGVSGVYELAMFPYRLDKLNLQQIIGPARFRQDNLAEVLKRGDNSEITAILHNEVPAVALYEIRLFAAIDARFCGGNPKTYSSWAWIADLYLCEEHR